MMRALRVAFPLLALGACTVGPNFKPPTPAVPAAYAGGGLHASSADKPASSLTDGPPNSKWWHEFHDVKLDELEERTQKGNLDLQAGLLRIVEARTQVLAARAQGLPALNASASYNRELLGVAGILKSEGGTFGAAGIDPGLESALTAPVNLYQVGFDASWELDLFGRVRRNVEAAKAQTESAVASRNDMLVSLEAEVAQTYLQLRAAQLLKSITEGLIADEQGILDLTTNRQAHGLAQDADVESARAQVATQRSQLPQFDQNIALARHALAVLIGQNPETLDVELGSSAELPSLPQLIPLGLPSTLARRRPDIRQAEASLHAATADVGVSIASLYPAVSLTGSFGLRSTSTHYLFDWASKFYSAGPGISLPIFEGGALVANIRMARAEAGAAALNYRKTVLSALKEVEDGLVSLDEDGVRVSALKDSVAANQRGLDIALHSYKIGLSTYISVLNLELQSNQARQQLAQASATELTDLVKLYKALGGGWEATAGEATPAEPVPADSASTDGRPTAGRLIN
jgi:multidrug efflux system outer membrane protein